MNTILTKNIEGMVDKSSNIELKFQEVYTNNKKSLYITATVNIIPHKDVNATNNIERFNFSVIEDDNVIIHEKLEVNLSQNFSKSFEKEIQLNSTQYEVHLFSASISNIANNKINYTEIRDMITLSPSKESKTYIKLNYYKKGYTHNFNYKTNKRDSRVFLKYNNNNWKEIFETFVIYDKDLEGRINYFQVYTLDDENRKIYSGVVRVIKESNSE